MSTLTIEDLVQLAKVGLGSTDWVDVFAAGTHKEGDREWTPADLDLIVRNFRLSRSFHEPPVGLVEAGLGHDQEQARLEDSGLPAAGRVVALRRRGPTLQAKFGNVPALVAEAINYGLYSRCSAELYDEPPPGVPGRGPMLRRVAFLGFDVPAVKRLRPLPRVQYSERLAPLRRGPRHAAGAATVARGPRLFVFAEYAEGTSVDEQAKQTLTAVIKGKYPDLPDDFLASLDDDQLNALAAACAGGGDGTGDGSTRMAEPPADRDTLISDILAAGGGQYTQEQLAAMTDDQLRELWQQVAGGGTTNMSDRPTPPTPAPAPAKPNLPAVVPPALARAYAELDRRAQALTRAQQAAEARIKAVEADARRRGRAEREQTVRAYCERWLRERKVSPAEADPTAKVPNLYTRLLAASGTAVRKYGERSYTEFDAAVAEIEQRPPGFARLFAEKITTGGAGADDDLADVTAQAKAYAAKFNKRKGA